MSDAPLVEMIDINKVFLTEELETHALSRVQLRIDKGDFVAISGPSGSGKTTLLSILGLLDAPSSGTHRLAGEDVADLGRTRRARVRNQKIGFVFQNFNLIGDLTVEENVELPLTHRDFDAADRRKRVAAALERVEMGHRARHFPAQLSGGQQQRVAVARAIAGDPAIILADEPTGNLDSKNGEMVMGLLRELHRGGATLCIVTHNAEYAQTATRTVTLLDGRIVDEGRP